MKTKWKSYWFISTTTGKQIWGNI